MIFMNTKMKKYYESKSKIKIPKNLMGLLDGFINYGEYTFFSAFHSPSDEIDEKIVRERYLNATRLECSVNSFHIEDYVTPGSIKNYTQAANLALCFIEEFIKKWNLHSIEPCVVIVSMNEASEFEPDAVFRFHKKRANEYWINVDELEKFNEAILVVEC